MKASKLIISTLAILSISVSVFGSTVDMDKSSFTWKGEKKVGDGHTGTVKLSKANVKLKKDGSIKSGEFVMDMTSIDVTDLNGEYKSKFLNHIATNDFFETKKFPEASLVVNEVKGNKAKGVLKIRKKSNPVTIEFKKSKNEYTGTLVFDRTKFDIVYGSSNYIKKLALDKVIKDEVKVDFKVVLK